MVRLLCQRRDSTAFLTELRMSMVLADMGLLVQSHREARRRTRPPAPWSPVPARRCGAPTRELNGAAHLSLGTRDRGAAGSAQRVGPGRERLVHERQPRCLFLGQQELDLFPKLRTCHREELKAHLPALSIRASYMLRAGPEELTSKPCQSRASGTALLSRGAVQASGEQPPQEGSGGLRSLPPKEPGPHQGPGLSGNTHTSLTGTRDFPWG